MTDERPFPKRAARGAGKAYITVPVSLRSIQEDGTQANCRKSLHVENAAMKRIANSESVCELDDIHKQVLFWERVGRCPNMYPKRLQPRAPLSGQQLYDFIGKRCKRTAEEVQRLLAVAEKILRQRIAAGLDE